MASRRFLIAYGCLFIAGCAWSTSTRTEPLEQLTIGTVAYGEEARSVDQYQRFVDYLENETKALVQLEPAYNEVKAAEQIRRHAWSLVFAPPGLAAIAVSKAQYLPLFPLEGIDDLSSVLVVLQDSPIKSLTDVNGQVLALGQSGSATGYYVPLYELYGTTPAEVRISPTPKTTLEWLANKEVAIGAMSKDQFERYRSQFNSVPFRILVSSRRIPSGSVLVSPTVDRNQQQLIQNAMSSALPAIAQEAGYLPTVQPPNYDDLITFIKKVEPIEARIRDKPAPLYSPH
jgi:phosphonate transport system substrate-binding protein